MSDKVSLVWVTPDAEKLIAKIARVSNPANENNEATAPKLIKYLKEHKHFSPFEMASACFEIYCPRYVSHQLVRHRSFSFQEFSQRYAVAPPDYQYTLPRMQDTKNRQNSIPTEDRALEGFWLSSQRDIKEHASALYDLALKHGIAKELARTILPEMTMSRIYMAGTIRSWIHFLDLRAAVDTQLETREIALQIKEILSKEMPSII